MFYFNAFKSRYCSFIWAALTIKQSKMGDHQPSGKPLVYLFFSIYLHFRFPYLQAERIGCQTSRFLQLSLLRQLRRLLPQTGHNQSGHEMSVSLGIPCTGAAGNPASGQLASQWGMDGARNQLSYFIIYPVRPYIRRRVPDPASRQLVRMNRDFYIVSLLSCIFVLHFPC